MIVAHEWAKEKADEYSEIFNASCFSENAYSHLYEYLDELAKQDEIGLELISSHRQSAFVSHRKGDSAIFFDIGQSLIIRNLLSKFGEGFNYYAIAEIVKEAASQFLLAHDAKHSLYLRNIRLFPDPGNFLPKERVKELEQSIQWIRGRFCDQEILNIVDYFIVGHEYFHYLKHRNKLPFDLERYSGPSFDAAFIACCYEEDSDFNEKLTYSGAFDFDDATTERLKKDLQNRRARYTHNRSALLEEVACDQSSFNLMIDYFIDYYDDFTTNDLISVGLTTYVITCFVDMHYSMTRRAILSTKSGIESGLPDFIADAHFRKMALAYSIWFRLLDILGDNEEIVQDHKDVFWKTFRDLKLAIDLLYITEVARRIRDSLKETERAIKENLVPENIPIIPELLYDFHIHEGILNADFISQFHRYNHKK